MEEEPLSLTVQGLRELGRRQFEQVTRIKKDGRSMPKNLQRLYDAALTAMPGVFGQESKVRDIVWGMLSHQLQTALGEQIDPDEATNWVKKTTDKWLYQNP